MAESSAGTRNAGERRRERIAVCVRSELAFTMANQVVKTRNPRSVRDAIPGQPAKRIHRMFERATPTDEENDDG
jgi:hypothetical protein